MTMKINSFINSRQRKSRFSVRLSDYFLNPAPQNCRFPCPVHKSNPAPRSLITLNSRIPDFKWAQSRIPKNLSETLPSVYLKLSFFAGCVNILKGVWSSFSQIYSRKLAFWDGRNLEFRISCVRKSCKWVYSGAGKQEHPIKNLETLPFYWWRFLKKRTRRENWERFRQSS